MDPLALLKRLLPRRLSSSETVFSPSKGTTPGERDTRAAIRELSLAVRNDPDAVEICLALGNLYRSQGDIERAVQVRSTLLVRPNLDDSFKAKAYLELGRDYKRGGFVDRALNAFEQAKRLGGDTVEILDATARLYAESGSFKLAADAYGKLGHGVVQAHYLVKHAEDLHSNGREPEGKRMLNKAVKVYKGSVEAWLAQIALATTDEDWKRSHTLLQNALNAVEPPVRFLILQGMLEFSAPKQISKADFYGNICQVVIPALEKQEPDLILQYYGALFLLRSGRNEEANTWLAKTMVLRPDFWAARLELLHLAMDEQPLSPVFRNQLEFFVKQAHHVKKFVCTHCGMRREQTFYVCPKCHSWHSAAFRTTLQD